MLDLGWEARRAQYRAYLQSAAWQARSAKCKRLAGRQCQRCGSRRELQAHHLHYRNIFAERPEDLVCLCRSCHLAEHGRMVEPFWSVYPFGKTEVVTIAAAIAAVLVWAWLKSVG